MRGLFTRHRFLVQASFDSASWLVGVILASWLRYEFEIEALRGWNLLLVAAVAAILQVLIGRFIGLYVHRWRYGTFEEVLHVGQVVALVTVITAALDATILDHAIPVGAALIAGPLALCLMVSGRFGFRWTLERQLRPLTSSSERVIVFGAGDGGHQVVRVLMGHPSSPYLPVAVLDDNPDTHRMRIKTIPVKGGRDQLAEVAQRHGASTLVVAIPSASAELLRELATLADSAGMHMLVLPPVSGLFGHSISFDDIRPLTEEDLLGRREIETDLEAVAGFLTGKRVLVTGAGGSIGSELCRIIHRFAPASLVMLDRDESALHSVQLSIEGRALLDNPELVVACIRDRERLADVFAEFEPEVVFHAAALKHLPLLEMHPTEGWKTNVWGTQHLLELSGHHGVERFVNVSTDKAADPVSVLGETKRVAERLTAHAGRVYAGTYLSVRFGNVLGSRGSVVPMFRAQIEAGGPVTVTDPQVTRFFMTIEEACQLVIQAGAVGESGEVMVLDMGEPVLVADIARRLISESGRRVGIVFTGLRPGEKLHETRFAEGEEPRPSSHPLVGAVDVPPLSPELLELRHSEAIDLRTTGGIDLPTSFSLGD